jgi:hypothetical protein
MALILFKKDDKSFLTLLFVFEKCQENYTPSDTIIIINGHDYF